MKVLIVDDEPLACARLHHLLSQINGFEAIDEYAHNAQQVYELTIKYKPNIILLDIKLPQVSGLQIASKLCAFDYPPAIIFCTAYDDFAIEAFKVNAVDYLLKPVRLEHLTNALNRATTLNMAQITALNSSNQPIYINVKARNGLVRIPIENVLYFVAEHKYVTLHHVNGELILNEPLKALEQKYCDYVIRIHRHTLIARNKILRLENNNFGSAKLYLLNVEKPFNVSRSYLKPLRNLLLKQQ